MRLPMVERVSIELAFQDVPGHPDISRRSLIRIDFLARLVQSDFTALR